MDDSQGGTRTGKEGCPDRCYGYVSGEECWGAGLMCLTKLFTFVNLSCLREPGSLLPPPPIPGSLPPPPPIPERDLPRPPGSPAPTPPTSAPRPPGPPAPTPPARPPGPTPTSPASTPRPLGRPASTPAGARAKGAQKQAKRSKLEGTKASFHYALNQATEAAVAAAKKSFSSPEKLLTGLSQKKKQELQAPVSPSGKIREARKSADKAKKSQETKDNRRMLMKRTRDEKKKAGFDEKRHGAGEEAA